MKEKIRESLARHIWKFATGLFELSCKVRGRHIEYYNRESLEVRCAVCGIKLDKLP